jgi:hypothetical protein
MRKRLLRACSAVSAVAGVTMALGLGAAGAASASVATHRDTPQCQAYGGGTTQCITWAEFAGGGSLGLRITATGGFVNAPVIMTQNDGSDPMQDFLVTNLGTVTTYFNGGANDLGLNAYDNTNYTNDELVSAEFAPGGVPTDLCVANVNDKLVLRQCNGLRWQTFIEATSIVEGGIGGGNPLSVTIPNNSALILSCAHVFDNGQHLALTGSNIDGVQGTFSHPHQTNLQFWSPETPT